MFSNQLFPHQVYPKHLYPRLYLKTKSLTDTITFSQILTGNTAGFQILSQSLSFTDTLTKQFIDVETLSNTLVVTQNLSYDIHVPTHISYTINHSFNLTQNVTSLNAGHLNKSLTDNLIFTDFLITNFRYFTDNLLFTDLLRRNVVYNKSLTDNIIFTASLSKITAKGGSFTDTLVFTQNIDAYKPVYSPLNPDVLHFTQTLSLKRRINERLIDALLFTDSLKNNQKYTHNLIDILLFTGGGGYTSDAPQVTKNIDGNTFIYQDAIAVKVHRYIILKSDNANIILPSPLFTDSQNNIGTISINRMVTGKVFTYVKTTKRQRLNYKFELKRQKAHELQVFIDNNTLKWLDLENWKGEVWKIRLINNPIIFEATGRGYVCPENSEVHQVELQFEGYRLSGSASGC